MRSMSDIPIGFRLAKPLDPTSAEGEAPGVARDSNDKLNFRLAPDRAGLSGLLVKRIELDRGIDTGPSRTGEDVVFTEKPKKGA